MRRLKKGSCSSSLGDDSLFAGQPLVKGSSKQLSSDEMKKEKAEQDWLKLCEFIEEMKFESSEVEAPDQSPLAVGNQSLWLWGNNLL